MTAVIEVRPLTGDGRFYFLGKWRNMLKPGDDRRNDEIPGLNMSLNQQTGIISIDAPGDSMSLHLSTVAARHPPAIDAGEWAEKLAEEHRKRARDEADDEPVIRRTAAPKPVTAAELGFDPNGDDIDDAEVAKLLQGKGAKKALAKKAAKKKAPAKKKAAPVYEEEDDGDQDEDGV